MDEIVIEAEPERLPPRTWDFLLTVALVLLVIVLAIVLALSALGFGVLNQACGDAGANCSETRIQIGQLICTFAPPVIALAGIVVAVVRVLRRRIAFWVLIVATVLMTGAFLVGSLLRDSGVSDIAG